MTIAKDATSPSTEGTGTLSWTHTPVGTPRGVGVSIIQDAGVDQVSGVTYGGVAMTEVAGSPNLKSTGEPGSVHCYWLGSSIPTGAQTVEVTVSGTADKVAFSVTVTAAADTEVHTTDATINSDSTSTPTATMALSGQECFVWEGCYTGGGAVTTISPLTNWAEDQEIDMGVRVGTLYTYDIVGSTDVEVGFSTTGAEDAIVLAVAIKEASAGGGSNKSYYNNFLHSIICQ